MDLLLSGSIIALSGFIGMKLDIELGVESPSLYWILGAIGGLIAGAVI